VIVVSGGKIGNSLHLMRPKPATLASAADSRVFDDGEAVQLGDCGRLGVEEIASEDSFSLAQEFPAGQPDLRGAGSIPACFNMAIPSTMRSFGLSEPVPGDPP
jgi:hypothetical protein